MIVCPHPPIEQCAPVRFADTLIVSDIHLGLEVSRVHELRCLIREWNFKQLILNGDIFQSLDFERLQREHWEFLSDIRTLSAPPRSAKVIWISGNHDQKLAKLFSAMLGAKVHKEYLWEEHGTRFLALHGHQFDRFIVDNKVISKLATFLYVFLQRIEGQSHIASRFVKRWSKLWLRMSEKVARGAMEYAAIKHANVVICGHTHLPDQKEHCGLRYFNSGCWVDSPCAYVTTYQGKATLHTQT